MASKMVTDREKSSRSVAAAAATHAAEIAAGFARELAPHLKAGEELPDLALVARLIGRKIAADIVELLRADEAHERELADDAAPREARDESATRVRNVLIDTRAAIETAYGSSGLRALGLDQAVPEDPSVLATTGATIVSALRDAAIKLPAPKRASMQVDRAGFAREIEAELPALVEALATVAVEEREKDATLRKKQGALSQSDRSFSRGAGWLSSSCTFAALDDLAAKVRPSGRRPGRTAEEEEPTPPEGGSGGS